MDINDQDKVKEMVDSVRCIRLSPDGKHLASGDEVGNIRIHDLVAQEIEQTKFMESHDSEVISLSYSPELAAANDPTGLEPAGGQRYFLASGGRDKTILVYDAEHDYEPFTDLGHHSSTITALQFNESVISKKGARIRPQIDLISGGADRNLVMKRLDLDKMDQCQTREQLAAAGSDPNALFKHVNCEICKDKILSMDVAKEAQYLATGHDKSLCLWKLPTFEKIWEKRASSLQDEAKGAKAEAGANTRTPLQLRVMVDDLASVVVSSSTSKRVTIYEAATGTPLCRGSPGQITTAMCFSNNLKHLITTSDSGIIYIWRLPQQLAKSLNKVKSDFLKLKQDMYRIPSMIEEAENEEENLTIREQNSVVSQDPKKKEAEEEKDADFEVPSKLQVSERDGTTMKKKKNEVVDVLAAITAATNLVSKVAQQSPARPAPGKAGTTSGPLKPEGQEESAEPVVENPFSKGLRGLAESQLPAWAQESDQSTPRQPMASESSDTKQARRPQIAIDLSEVTAAEALAKAGPGEESKGPFEKTDEEKKADTGKHASLQITNSLSDHDSDDDIVPGEDQADDAEQLNIKKHIDKGRYANRYANFGEEADEQQFAMLRQSTEMQVRNSITSNLAFRRKTVNTSQTGSSGNRGSESASARKNRPDSRVSAASAEPDISRMLTPGDHAGGMEVTDIVDDEDILDKKGSVEHRGASEPQASSKPKELIQAKNAIHVQNFDANSAGKPPALQLTPKGKGQAENQDGKEAKTEQKPPAPTLASAANASDKKEPKRAGWGPPVLGEDANRTNVAPASTDARRPPAAGGGVSAFPAGQGKGAPAIDTRPTELILQQQTRTLAKKTEEAKQAAKPGAGAPVLQSVATVAPDEAEELKEEEKSFSGPPQFPGKRGAGGKQTAPFSEEPKREAAVAKAVSQQMDA